MSWLYEFHYLESWGLFMLKENQEKQGNGWKTQESNKKKCMPEWNMAAMVFFLTEFYQPRTSQGWN